MKVVLTSYGFPSALVLGLAQFVLTTVVFGTLHALGQVAIARPTPDLIVRRRRGPQSCRHARPRVGWAAGV